MGVWGWGGALAGVWAGLGRGLAGFGLGWAGLVGLLELRSDSSHQHSSSAPSAVSASASSHVLPRSTGGGATLGEGEEEKVGSADVRRPEVAQAAVSVTFDPSCCCGGI